MTAIHGVRFTNQQLIDAFYNAAKARNLDDPWALLIKAGLDLNALATARQAPYGGTPVDDLPVLSDDERALVKEKLLAELAKARLWRGLVEAPAGLSLRAGPDTSAERLAILEDGSPVQVLEEAGEWLRVLADGRMGFVFRRFVAMDDDNEQPAPPQARYLWQDPALADILLEPPAGLTSPLDQGGLSGRAFFLARIWNRYGGLLQALAGRLGMDPGVAVAVFATEAGGYALAEEERMVIRFENHIFFNEWGKRHPDKFAQHFRFNPAPGQSWKDHQWRPSPDQPWQSFHGDQEREWAVFTFACTLDDDAAKRSISMGIAQIMGFNCRALGYATAGEMFDALSRDLRRQVFSFFDFVRQKPGTVEALRRGDFRTFARIYNGPGQMDTYAKLISDDNETFQKVSPQPVAAEAPAEAPAPSQLPLPAVGGEVDEALREAWRAHIKQGFENNQKMFSQILDAFMKPYYTTVWMYRILFAVGILAFVAALIFGFTKQEFSFSLVFGGLSVASFLTYFLSKPLRSLEENLQFITWLGIIYNTYWTRQAFMLDQGTVQADLEQATQQAIDQLQQLIDKNAALDDKRPDLGDDS